MSAVAAGAGGGGGQLLADAVDALASEALEHLDQGALSQTLMTMRRHMDRLEAEFVRRLARFEALGGPAAAGAVNTAAWLRWKCRLSGPAAAERVEVARQIPGLVDTAAAFRRGDVGYQHAAVMARSVTDLGVDAVKNAEHELLNVAQAVDAGRFRYVAQHLRHCLDPAGALDAANALYARRFLRVSQGPNGGFAVEGLLDTEGGALLRTALHALEGPPARNEDRTPGQRRADALVELASRQLRADMPSVHGQRPHLIVATTPSGSDGRGGLGPGELQGAGPIARETVERLACDASLTSITAGSGGQPLDVGRRSRTASAAIRTALTLRDRGCRFPGCDRPPEWTDTHHIRHWSSLGRTRLPNLVLLCRRHHRLMHEHGWTIRLGPTGEVEVRAPQQPQSATVKS